MLRMNPRAYHSALVSSILSTRTEFTIGTARPDRPKFRRLFRDAHRGRFDIVLFWSVDRFSREGALKTLQHLQQLSDYGCQWKSLTQEYLDSTGVFADAIVALLAVLAQQERETIRARVKAGMARAVINTAPMAPKLKASDRISTKKRFMPAT